MNTGWVNFAVFSRLASRVRLEPWSSARLRHSECNQARLAHLLFTNINLALVVSVSFGRQVWSQHNATLGRFLKTSFISLVDCVLLLAVGAIPLVVLELVKLGQHAGGKEQLRPDQEIVRTASTPKHEPMINR